MGEGPDGERASAFFLGLSDPWTRYQVGGAESRVRWENGELLFK